MEQWGKSAFSELFMSSQVVKIKWYMYTQQWACLMQQTALGVFDGKQRMDTLMSYTERSVKCQFQSNTPIVWGWSVGPIMKYTLFCTFLFHCTFYSYFSFFTIYMLLCCVTLYNFYSSALSTERTWFDYISLLIIPCIIYYVTNKETLNLEHHSAWPIKLWTYDHAFRFGIFRFCQKCQCERQDQDQMYHFLFWFEPK